MEYATQIHPETKAVTKSSRRLAIPVWLVVVLLLGSLILYDIIPILTAGKRRARLHELAIPGTKWSSIEPVLIREDYFIAHEISGSRKLVHLDKRTSYLFRLYVFVGMQLRNPSDRVTFALLAWKKFIGAVALDEMTGTVTSVDDPKTY